jgi:hypothetical protein
LAFPFPRLALLAGQDRPFGVEVTLWLFGVGFASQLHHVGGAAHLFLKVVGGVIDPEDKPSL